MKITIKMPAVGSSRGKPLDVEIDAQPRGKYLAIHRRVIDPQGTLAKGIGEFNITHIPSGYRLVEGLTHADAMRKTQAVLDSGVDLNFTVEEFNKWPQADRDQLAMLLGRKVHSKPLTDEEALPEIPPKLRRLLSNWGITGEDLLHMTVMESTLPGICMNEGCDYTTEVEPDQRAGYCEECQTTTVTSGGVLAGLI